MMCMDFEGDCYSDPFLLYIVFDNNRCTITTGRGGEMVYQEQQLIDLAKTQTVYVESSSVWDLLRLKYPEAYRLLTGQLDSMLIASPWWSPVHILDWAAESIPAHMRYVITSGWLANTSTQRRWQQFAKSMKIIRLAKRFISRREA